MIFFRMADMCSLSIIDRMRMIEIIDKPLPENTDILYTEPDFNKLVKLFWDDKFMYIHAFEKCWLWTERMEKVMLN